MNTRLSAICALKSTRGMSERYSTRKSSQVVLAAIERLLRLDLGDSTRRPIKSALHSHARARRSGTGQMSFCETNSMARPSHTTLAPPCVLSNHEACGHWRGSGGIWKPIVALCSCDCHSSCPLPKKDTVDQQRWIDECTCPRENIPPRLLRSR
jgi:hypothetical protein